MTVPTLQAGDWVSTGWGAQHRIREVQAKHIVLVCHGIDPGHRVEISRVRLDANERGRCHRCERVHGLGPTVPGLVGEIRRTPEGWIGVCVVEYGAASDRWVFLDPRPMERWAPDWFMGNADRIGAVPGSPADKDGA